MNADWTYSVLVGQSLLTPYSKAIANCQESEKKTEAVRIKPKSATYRGRIFLGRSETKTSPKDEIKITVLTGIQVCECVYWGVPPHAE